MFQAIKVADTIARRPTRSPTEFLRHDEWTSNERITTTDTSVVGLKLCIVRRETESIIPSRVAGENYPQWGIFPVAQHAAVCHIVAVAGA